MSRKEGFRGGRLFRVNPGRDFSKRPKLVKNTFHFPVFPVKFFVYIFHRKEVGTFPLICNINFPSFKAFAHDAMTCTLHNQK